MNSTPQPQILMAPKERDYQPRSQRTQTKVTPRNPNCTQEVYQQYNWNTPVILSCMLPNQTPIPQTPQFPKIITQYSGTTYSNPVHLLPILPCETYGWPALPAQGGYWPEKHQYNKSFTQAAHNQYEEPKPRTTLMDMCHVTATTISEQIPDIEINVSQDGGDETSQYRQISGSQSCRPASMNEASLERLTTQVEDMTASEWKNKKVIQRRASMPSLSSASADEKSGALGEKTAADTFCSEYVGYYIRGESNDEVEGRI